MDRPRLSDFKFMLVLIAFFAAVAIGFAVALDNVFFLYNFSIIGASVALGVGLWPLLKGEKKPWARRLSQVLVGGYMFFGLGLGFIFMGSGVLEPENMQIEGFWLMVFGGVFTSAAIHYFVGKILGPTVFNRGWCGWACWTTGVLDLLPWKKSPGRLPGRWGHLRYVHFALVLVAVSGLVVLGDYGLDRHLGAVVLDATVQTDTIAYGNLFQVPALRWFLVGNALYYASGIALAAVLRDNRAFCKYLCPIVGFLKPAASVSLARIGAKNDDCTRCRKCERSCPMDVEVRRYVDEGKKVLSTECVLCLTCTAVCPEGVLGVTMGPSLSNADYLRVRKPARKEAS